jgi:hypothetical protein
MRKTIALLLAATGIVVFAAQAHASHRYVPQSRLDEIAVGTQENPLFVHNQPSQNAGGGSQAWADYGLYQVLRATRPSPAAKAVCAIDTPGDVLWVEGGMMLPGEWDAVTVTAFNRRGSDVDVFVDDPDGTHGGDCSPVGLVLRHVG